MSKRQPIPAALREEFKEYSSLLRALRTSHTLDLPAHLTEPYTKNDSDNDGDEGGPSTSTTPAASRGTSIETGGGAGSKRKRSESESESTHWRNRDQWTRWPIPLKDVPLPDWPLQDEIGTIIKSVLSSNRGSYSPSPDEGSNDYDNNEDEDDRMETEPPTNIKQEQTSSDIDSEDEQDAYVHSLAETVTPVVQTKLESLFALISAHTIARSDSMQNRIEPFDWRDLLNIMGSPAAGHLVDETMLQNITTRMEQIFETTPASTSNSVPAPLPSTAIHRHVLAQTSRARLRDLLSKHTSSLFEQILPPTDYKFLTSRQISARKKKAEKKRSKKWVGIEEDGEGGVEGEKEGGKEGGKEQNLGVLEVKGKGVAKGNGGRGRAASNAEQHQNEEQDEDSDWNTDSNSFS